MDNQYISALATLSKDRNVYFMCTKTLQQVRELNVGLKEVAYACGLLFMFSDTKTCRALDVASGTFSSVQYAGKFKPRQSNEFKKHLVIANSKYVIVNAFASEFSTWTVYDLEAIKGIKSSIKKGYISDSTLPLYTIQVPGRCRIVMDETHIVSHSYDSDRCEIAIWDFSRIDPSEQQNLLLSLCDNEYENETE
jgi:hypothetical protein